MLPPSPAVAEPAPTRPAARKGGSLRTRRVGAGLGLLLAIVGVALLHDDYGVTWDEGLQAEYGERALDYFLTGGKNLLALEDVSQRLYGPAFEIPPAALDRLTGLPKFRMRHLFVGLVALLALPGVALLGSRFREPLVPGLSLIALLMLPRFVGHAFINSKDIPLAVAFVWFIMAALWLFADRDLRWRRVAACGAALGVTLWARPGAFPLLAVLLAIAAAAGFLLGERARPVAAAGGTARTAAALLAVVAIGWVLMVLPWPWAHASPVSNPIRAMRAAASFPVELPVLFEGEIYRSGALPRRYAVEFLAITTPPGLLVLAFVGLLLCLRRVARGSRGRDRATASMLLAWLLLPLTLAVVLRPNLYDGIRHLLFVLPAVALLAALGGAWLVERAGSGLRRKGALVVVTALILAPLPAMLRLHPYEMTYFNAFVGGTAGADGRFETDYWASSYGEAVRWINREAAGRDVRVLVAGSHFVREAAEYTADPGVEILTRGNLATLEGVALEADVDYYLATTRHGLDREYPGAPVVHVVGRDGARFSVVKDLGARRPGSATVGPP